MKKTIVIGFVFLLGTMAASSGWAAEKAKPAVSTARKAPAQKKTVYVVRTYATPSDPNRYIIKIPQAPKPLALPITDQIKKPEKKQIPR